MQQEGQEKKPLAETYEHKWYFIRKKRLKALSSGHHAKGGRSRGRITSKHRGKRPKKVNQPSVERQSSKRLKIDFTVVGRLAED